MKIISQSRNYQLEYDEVYKVYKLHFGKVYTVQFERAEFKNLVKNSCVHLLQEEIK